MIEKLCLEFYQKSADYIRERIPQLPQIALVLGSCLGKLAEEVENQVILDYKDIPNFLQTTVESHAGKLIFGTLHGKAVVCLSGRFHYYEGYEFEELAAPIRVLHLLGVKHVILTNAAGAINRSYKVGDIMIMEDHIKLTGASPVRGKNIPEFGERFFDVSHMYTQRLRGLAWDCACQLGQQYRTHKGVYFYAMGPQFETPAEIRAMRILGGDAVGMSTVTEAITAAHCSMEVLGLSLMTNMAAGVLPQKLTVDEVDATAMDSAERFQKLVGKIVKEI